MAVLYNGTHTHAEVGQLISLSQSAQSVHRSLRTSPPLAHSFKCCPLLCCQGKIPLQSSTQSDWLGCELPCPSPSGTLVLSPALPRSLFHSLAVAWSSSPSPAVSLAFLHLSPSSLPLYPFIFISLSPSFSLSGSHNRSIQSSHVSLLFSHMFSFAALLIPLIRPSLFLHLLSIHLSPHPSSFYLLSLC